MAVTKWINDSILDAALNTIKSGATTRATHIIACSSGAIDTFGEAWKTNASGGFRLTQIAGGATASGNYTIANGDTSGRKITCAAVNSVPVDAAGTFAAVALVHSSGSSGTLLAVTTGVGQSLALGNNANFPAWDIELRDPS